MRLLPVTAALLGALILVAAGCAGPSVPIEPATAAAPQKHETRWVEASGEGGEKLVYEVRSFEVTAGGWTAEVAVENRTGVTWKFLPHPVWGRMGLRVFASGDVEDLEKRVVEGDLPGLRAARAISPPLPGALGPRQRWSGRITGTGPLPAGRWVRVEFPLLETGRAPSGLPARANWITDRALRLS